MNQAEELQLRKKIESFFLTRQLGVQQIQSQNLLQDILKQCHLGLDKKKSSLRMINTYMSREINFRKDRRNENCLKLVVDAGGTNFRVVVLHFGENQQEIVYYTKNPMPGSKEKITKNLFFKKIVDFLVPVLDSDDFGKYDPTFEKFTVIQFCFSYPTAIDETGEGYVRGMTKEICIDGLIGEPIKKNLLLELHQRGYGYIKDVVILNDTTATLLAGCYQKAFSEELDHYDGFLGLVWGTGLNIAYEENYFFSMPYLVNSEIGNYDGFFMTSLDEEIDKLSVTPNEGLAEKKISGYYFGLLYTRLLYSIIEEFSKEGNACILTDRLEKIIVNKHNLITSENISRFLRQENSSTHPYFFYSCLEDEKSIAIQQADYISLQIIIELLSKRSTYLTALLTTALMLRSIGITDLDNESVYKNGKSKKICVTIDGSMICKMPHLKEMFIGYLGELVKPYALVFDLVEVDNAPILGSSIAQLNLY